MGSVFELNVMELEAVNRLLSYTAHDVFDFPRLESQFRPASDIILFALLIVQVSKNGVYLVIQPNT